MRTLLFIIAGLALLALSTIIGQRTGHLRAVLTGFVVVWLLVAGYNMWMGVARAGYSVAEELPIFLLIFAVPAIGAAVMIWRSARLPG